MHEIKVVSINLPLTHTDVFPSARTSLCFNYPNRFNRCSQHLTSVLDAGSKTSRDPSIKKFITSPRSIVKPQGDSINHQSIDLNEPYCATERTAKINKTTRRENARIDKPKIKNKKNENKVAENMKLGRIVYASKPLSWSKKTNKAISIFKQCFVLEKLRGYLSFKDYFSLMLTSKRIYSKTSIVKKIEQVILHQLSNEQRLRYWKHQCSVESLKRHALLSYTDYKRADHKETYEMKKDLQRISSLENPFHLSKEGIEKLENVLKAFAQKNMDIKYTQGLNFVAGTLLHTFNEEEVLLKLII